MNTVPPCARGILDLARTKMLATFQARHLWDLVLMPSYLYLLFNQSTSKFVHMCSCCQVFLRSPALLFGDGIFSDPDSCSCCASFIGSRPRLVCCIPVDGDLKVGRRDVRGKASGNDGKRERELQDGASAGIAERLRVPCMPTTCFEVNVTSQPSVPLRMRTRCSLLESPMKDRRISSAADREARALRLRPSPVSTRPLFSRTRQPRSSTNHDLDSQSTRHERGRLFLQG